MNFKKLNIFLVIFFTSTKLFATEISNHQYNFFTGNFDFSDDKQSAMLVGFQHQNEDLERDTFLGNISPITGGFITENSAVYVYTGFEWNIDMGALTFTPSFAPGLYHKGDGKDLGHALEFKSEIQFSYNSSENSKIGIEKKSLSISMLFGADDRTLEDKEVAEELEKILSDISKKIPLEIRD